MKLHSWVMAAALTGAAALCGIARLAQADPTTQPSGNVIPPLEFRANQAYNQGRYSAALPLLQELAGNLIDEPDKLGPVEERVRVCEKAIAKAQQLKAAGIDTGIGTPVPSAETRHPHPPTPPGAFLDCPIKELGNFDYDQEKGGNIPEDVVRLDGSLLRTRGYMVPLDQAENISQFALVPSLFACCFGQPPQIQHTIVVQLPPGKAVNYFPDELQVEGTLHVKEVKDEGYIVSIFGMDATSVKPAPR